MVPMSSHGNLMAMATMMMMMAMMIATVLLSSSSLGVPVVGAFTAPPTIIRRTSSRCRASESARPSSPLQSCKALTRFRGTASTATSLSATAGAAAVPPSSPPSSSGPVTGGFRRLREALPFRGDDLDKLIVRTAVPSVLNLAVVPLVNSVDTFWVGRLGVALALAGQSAANQACFTVWFLIAFVPNITAPLVAKAVASGDESQAQKRVCESIFLCHLLGAVGTLVLVAFPRQVLSALLLPPGAPAMEYAAPYLRWRALGMVPSLVAATGSAAYRGLLDTVTPLKVSLATNAVNLVLDPLLIYGTPFRFVGAAVATAAAEAMGGAIYVRMLLRRGLARWSLLLRPPSWKALAPLLRGGAAMLLRQLALNVGFLVATRRAQQMDPTGVAGAAYGITMQIYSVGIITLVGMQGCAAALVPSYLAREGTDGARKCADRLLSWSSLVGLALGVTQFLLLPVLVPLFSTLPSVREAVRVPSLVASLIHVVNGPILAGEGILMGLGCYRALAAITVTYIASMVGCLTCTPLGGRLDGIMWSILFSSALNQLFVVGHYLKIGPLAVKRTTTTAAAAAAAVTAAKTNGTSDATTAAAAAASTNGSSSGSPAAEAATPPQEKRAGGGGDDDDKVESSEAITPTTPAADNIIT